MTAPAEPGALLDLEDLGELKTEINQTRLDQAIADIRDYCGWHIAPSFTETIKVDGPGRRVLLLPTKHITAVDSVTENGTELVEGTDFEWSEIGMLRRLGGCVWTDRWRSIEIEFTHGYPVVPMVLRSLIFDVTTAAIALEVGQKPEKMGPFEFGGRSGVDFAPHEEAILDRYRVAPGPA